MNKDKFPDKLSDKVNDFAKMMKVETRGPSPEQVQASVGVGVDGSGKSIPATSASDSKEDALKRAFKQFTTRTNRGNE